MVLFDSGEGRGGLKESRTGWRGFKYDKTNNLFLIKHQASQHLGLVEVV